mmetsp:Transcript_20200/g.24962  ORF Transcript_20200/g.24962 Transcript_20200/m.24962 type:complete len:87 (-) Transcript_20200:585-845(-)
MSRGGFWEITVQLFEERQLCDELSCASWRRKRTSGKFLLGALFVESLFAASFAFFAFGELDQGGQCYGQTIKSFNYLEVTELRRVT